MEYLIRIPTSVLHWFENGDLVKNPEFSTNMEVLRTGINTNFNDIQDLQKAKQQVIIDIGTVVENVEELRGRVDTAEGKIEELISAVREMPTDVADLTNSLGYITNATEGLVHYYKKAEVNSLVSGLVGLQLVFVTELPTENINIHAMYFVPKEGSINDIYDEWVNPTGTVDGWEHIGTTEVDLSNFYEKPEVDAKFEEERSYTDTAIEETKTYVNDQIALALEPIAQAVQEQSEVLV